MNTRTHAAANIITGEVLTSNHRNALRRRVAQIERWNLRHGYGSGRWVFAHGSDWGSKLGQKFIAQK